MTYRDLISRQTLIDYVKSKDNDGYFENETKKVIKIIEQMPSAEKTAEWIDDDEYLSENTNCSSCHFLMLKEFKKRCNYCPHCGAIMKGDVK